MWDLIVSVPDHYLSFYFTWYMTPLPLAKRVFMFNIIHQLTYYGHIDISCI